MNGACIYDSLSPCEDCGRCKYRRYEDEEEQADDRDEWKNEDEDNYECWEDRR